MPASKEKNLKSGNKIVNKRFDEIHSKNLELLKERVAKNNINDSSEDDSDDGEKNDDSSRNKLQSLFREYRGNENEISSFQQYFDGLDTDCLICLRTIKSKDKIFSCKKCYCILHLLCIQKWANDSINLKKLWHDQQPSGYYDNQGNFIKKKELELCFDCPACRFKYQDYEIPRHYECYCGKERDPTVQDWLIPHSCGNLCLKPLENDCGHKCMLLCHPGKCPPCPQTIQTSCECRKSQIKTIRCSQKSWNCSLKCSKVLSCGVHVCEGICHTECFACKKKSKKTCFCGRLSKEILCREESWSCEKVCGKLLACGNHRCAEKCHGTECKDCPFGLTRSCYCGKKTFTVTSCNESLLDSCADTCLKSLACGHSCLARCHRDECPPCTEQVEKRCRCGQTSKMFPCSKELLCESKCNNQKSCKKHVCKARCCVECPPCNNICAKTLGCGKHKCEALCHSGACFPCMEKQKITCRCGATTIFIRCGKGNKNKYPKCKELCKIGSKCHHSAMPHYCHLGTCPTCKQVCEELLECGHYCKDECHDYAKVVIYDKNYVPAGPWDIQHAKIEYQKLPHSPCATKVPITCLGGHETVDVNCSEARITSCGRKCSRKLACGNHACQKECHSFANINSEDQDENCEECALPCTKERPPGCTHVCTRQCHDSSKSCRKCVVQIKSKCFCGLTDVYYRCCDVNKRDLDSSALNQLKQKYLCCGSRCIKNYPCGHPCTGMCHDGECKGAEACTRKVKLICVCKNRKMELTCDMVRKEGLKVAPCNEECEEKKRLVYEENQKRIQRELELEAEKNRKEVEEYEKKFGPKKYKERKKRYVEEEKSNFSTKVAVSAFIALTLAVILYLSIY